MHQPFSMEMSRHRGDLTHDPHRFRRWKRPLMRIVRARDSPSTYSMRMHGRPWYSIEAEIFGHTGVLQAGL